MVRCLAALDGRYRADEVVVGVLDESIVPQLTRELEESRVTARWVVGRTVRETAPYKLLGAVASMLDRGRFRDFAALVRHADVSQWLTEQTGTDQWLIELDEYYSQHLPPQPGSWLGDPTQCALLQQVVALIQDALQPLRGAAQPLRQWAPAIAQLLATFYGDRSFRPDVPEESYTLEALQQLRESLLLYSEIPAPIDPLLAASQAVAQTATQVASANPIAARRESTGAAGVVGAATGRGTGGDSDRVQRGQRTDQCQLGPVPAQPAASTAGSGRQPPPLRT